MNIRIALAGGGTGGHLYPLLAVADAIKEATHNDVRISYFGPRHQLINEFEARNIKIYDIASSKLRRYAAFQNIIDFPKFIWSIFQALANLYTEMPNVVFSKGGPGALPVVLAARWYMIPVVIHESDAVPGLTNTISGKHAARILLAFKEAEAFFPKNKTRVVGNPVRAMFTSRIGDERQAKLGLQFNPDKPLALMLGGSQGSQRVNTFILDNLDQFLPVFQIAHQTGLDNFVAARAQAATMTQRLDQTLQSQYKPYGYLAADQMKMLFDAADIIISRAGSGAIFEIAATGKPAILIPLSDAAQDHQRANAYAYASTGAAFVVEEANFTANLILTKINSVLKDPNALEKVKTAAHNFFKPNAAHDIALEVLSAVK